MAILNQSITLVTGAGGFIGSHLVEQLLSRGVKVRAFIKYNSRHDIGLLKIISQRNRNNLEIIEGDLRDPQALIRATQKCNIVFHLGALVSIPYSYLYPGEVIETNLTGTYNVLSACKKNGVNRVIQTSTSEVYGTAQYIPIDEKHPLRGQSPYSASKIGAEKLAESFYCSYALPVVILRPFNTYGPRQTTRAIIPTIISQEIKNEKINLGNIETTRDFTYVIDTVMGFIKAATAENVEGKTINLGTGRETSIRELIKIILEMVNCKSEIVSDLSRIRPNNSEVMRLVSDNSYAHTILGWKPKYSLEEGIELTIKWIKDNYQQYSEFYLT